jgi:uncharacterized protein YyaL (SSP411 family)
MIAALADAGAALGRRDYVDAALACADFIDRDMRDAEGRLLRTYKDGRASLNAYLEDHAFLVEALLVLYEATFETRRFVRARALADSMIERYHDEGAGFFSTSRDHEELIVRPKDFEDHPIPSGNSAAAYGLLRLSAFTGGRQYEDHAREVFEVLHEAAARYAPAFGHLLQAMYLYFSPRREVALVGEAIDELADVVRRRYHPTIAIAGMAPQGTEAEASIPLLAGRTAIDGRPAAYVCENFVCNLPVTDPVALEQQLRKSALEPASKTNSLRG